MAKGKPTLRPWEEVGLEEIGQEAELSRLSEVDAAAAAVAGMKLVEPATEAAAAAALPEPAEPPEQHTASGGPVLPMSQS